MKPHIPPMRISENPQRLASSTFLTEVLDVNVIDPLQLTSKALVNKSTMYRLSWKLLLALLKLQSDKDPPRCQTHSSDAHVAQLADAGQNHHFSAVRHLPRQGHPLHAWRASLPSK